MMGTKSRAKVREIASQIKAYLVQRYGRGIDSVLLYGSCARGQARAESDIDLLVLVDDSLRPSEVRKSLSNFIYDILLEKDELVSVIVLPRSVYEKGGSIFLRRVRQEAVQI